jgi:excisionase family DNA binding protein
MTPALLTVAEAAETLRCKRTRVFELIADGTLVRGAKYGRKTVVLAESVFAALEKTYDPPAKKRTRFRTNRSFEAALDEVVARQRAGL